MTPRGTDGQTRVETLLVLAGVAVACLLVMWAAAIGPDAILRGDGNQGSSTSTFQQEQPPGDDGDEDEVSAPQQPWTENPWVNAVTMVAGVVLLVGFLLWAVGATRERRRAARESVVDDGDDELTLDPAQRAAVVTDHAAAQFEALRGGTPRNAIVALWQELEDDVAGTGLSRRASETSVEFTHRFLAELRVDPGAAERLGALYREARFSTHELTEEHRAAAEQALSSLHASLGSSTR